MDKIDRKIIAVLQSDGRASVETVAQAVGLSPTPTRRRIKKLEQSGVILAYAAIADPGRCGLDLTVYVAVRLEKRSRANIESFENAVKDMAEIVRCDLVTGSFDYLMQLHLPSMARYNDYLHNVIAEVPGIAGIESSIVIGNVKNSHRLALNAD